MTRFRYIAVSRAVSRDHVFALHRAECPDLERRERREYGGTFQGIKASSPEKALDLYIDAELREMGYTNRDVKVFPCVKDATPLETS